MRYWAGLPQRHHRRRCRRVLRRPPGPFSRLCPGCWRCLTVLAGDSAQAASEITAEADAAGLTAARCTGAGTCVRYLTTKHEYLRYDQALAAGWPIATGVTEGACRHLPVN
jgi:hypothetical protein